MTDQPPWDKAAEVRPGWQSVSDYVAFQNLWIRVESHDVIAPTGHPAHYGLVRFANRAIAVIPVFDDGTVSLVGQARFAVGAWSWELPEGGAPLGEDPLDGAKRELGEETGLIAATWQEILSFDISNSVTDERGVCFLATGLTPGPKAPDETERFEYARIPFKDVLQAVIKGQIRDLLTVVSVLRVHHMAVTGEISSPLRDKLLA